MDRFEAMSVFAKVARVGGFAKAARELNLSTSAVSRHVGQLEEHLNTRLLQRSTRTLSLTAMGTVYLRKCERILDAVKEVEDELEAGSAIPRGRLRISAGVSFSQEHLGSLVASFAQRYEQVEIDLLLSDRHLNLIDEGIDVAVRIGILPDTGLFARRLASCHHVVCASPDYVARWGSIEHPHELAQHQLIIDSNQPNKWKFRGVEGSLTHSVQGRYTVNSAHAARDAVLCGLGVAYLPTFVAGPAIIEGNLVPQLIKYHALEMSIHAVYPESRHLSVSVRAFIDDLAIAFGQVPHWDRWMTSH